MKSQVNKRFIYTLISAIIIIIGTILAIQYAKGNLRITKDGFIQGTGLLAANSFPTASEVFIDDRFITATDDTVYLEPGEYNIKIKKNGYNSWSKDIKIEKELVVQTNATLFPKAPSLNTLTFSGAENISPSPNGQQIIFYSNSNSSTKKNGLYILELSNNPLSFQKEAKQISDNPLDFNLKDAKFIWSPNSNEVMLITNNHEVLLDVSKMNLLNTLQDTSYKQKQILSEWEEEMYLREQESLSKFPEEIVYLATTSAKNVYISPDKKRLLYTATEVFTLPATLKATIPVTSSQPEERTTVVNGVYVYDREENKNFRVSTQQETAVEKYKTLLTTNLLTEQTTDATHSAFTSLQATTSAQTADNFSIYHTPLFSHAMQWFPDSKHLIYIQDSSIKIMEYDSTNQTSIYSGPFVENFVYPWPNGDRLVILTSFSPNTPNNLYAVELKK